MESMSGDTGISDEEWDLFVESFQDAFANDVSELALAYWNDR